jgi:choline dehydrogenase-like flavoprotein
MRPTARAAVIVDGAQLTGRRVLRAGACVIGSGAGGAVVAAELALAGVDVVVLEEGEHPTIGDATARPRDMVPRLYRDGGQVITLGRPPLMLPLGRGTGGTTFVNSGTCFRTPAPVMGRWEREHGIEPLRQAVFDRVESALGVAEVSPALAGRNAAVIRRGARRLGWSGGYLRRNARGCQGSGVCAFGCPTGAKQHVGEVYLPLAPDAGATIVTRGWTSRSGACASALC